MLLAEQVCGLRTDSVQEVLFLPQCFYVDIECASDAILGYAAFYRAQDHLVFLDSRKTADTLAYVKASSSVEMRHATSSTPSSERTAMRIADHAISSQKAAEAALIGATGRRTFCLINQKPRQKSAAFEDHAERCKHLTVG